MKIKNTTLGVQLTVYGTIEIETKNFKVEVSGTIKIDKDRYGILYIEEEYVDEEQFWFRGDRIHYTPVKERLAKEGSLELVKELESLNNKSMKALYKAKNIKKEIKRVYEVDKVLFYDKLNKEEQILIRMASLVKNFEHETYSRQKEVCNRNYGFNFDITTEELAKELVDHKTFLERFATLLNRNKRMAKFLTEKVSL